MVSKLNYGEIIAIAEDPDVREGESRVRPASPESMAQTAEVADRLFLQCPFDEKIEDILHFPPAISARRLATMTDQERDEIFAHLPASLVDEIVSLLPVSLL